LQLFLSNFRINASTRAKDSLDQTLHLAVASGDHVAIRILLASGCVNIDCLNSEGDNALVLAIKNHDAYEPPVDLLQIVDSLISNRPKLDIKFQDTCGRSALWYAVDIDDEDLVLYITGLEGIDFNTFDHSGFTPLARAAEKGSWRMVKLLLSQSAVQLNAHRPEAVPPLWAACRAGQICVVELLLSQKSININQKSPTGTMPLQVALSMGHLSIAHLLPNQKAEIEINYVDWSGLTALMHASIKGYSEIIELLLKNIKINVNLIDNAERTALWYAAAGGHLDAVRLLATYPGIQIHIADRSGSTAQDIADHRGHSYVCRFLRRRN
jgi:ankyrin repeat protein